MKLVPLKTNCPKCGSEDITYSCEPECCFNHVCGNCLHSFQLLTRYTGRTRSGLNTPAPDKDSCDPAAACVRCKGLDVWTVQESNGASEIVCLSCLAILELCLE